MAGAHVMAAAKLVNGLGKPDGDTNGRRGGRPNGVPTQEAFLTLPR